MTFSVADAIDVVRMLFVSQVETSSVGHVHLEATRSKALSLRLLNASNLLF